MDFVGSPGFIKDGISNIGKVEIFLGTATGIDLTVAPNFILYGDTLVKKAGTVSLGVGPRFGQSISCGMDINGDGADDFIIAAPNATYIDTVGGVSDTITSAGSAYVFYGPTLDSDTLYGNEVNLRLGTTVAGLGNLNGDAFADFAIGAPGFQNNRGLVLVYRGLMGGFTASPTDSLKGIQEGELFGSALAGVRDVGGDGRADILVGAHQYNNGTDTAAGRAALYRGQAGAMPVTSAWQAIGPHKNAYLGFSVAGGGNFNGVGLPDVLIGVKQYNQEFISTMTDTISGYGLGTGNGAVYVYQGTVTGLSATPITILKTDFPASGFGSAVSYAGDVDGDGLHDVIVGAPTFTKHFKDEGASFAFYGKNFQAGQDITFDWCAVGEKLEANFGSSLTNSGLCVVDTSTIYVGAVGFPNVDSLRSGAVFSFKGDRCGSIKVAEPMFTSFLPDTIFRVAGLDTCGAFVPFMYPMIGVNCPDEASLSITTAIDSGGFFPIGDNLVTFRIESEGKIVDSSFIVKVFDNQAPEIQTCPTTVSIILSGTDSEGTVTWDDPIFNDNSSCAGQTLTLVQESGPAKGSMQGIGVYPIVYKSTDESGNEAFCTFRVIVRKGGADGRDCNDQAINANLMIAKNTNPGANFEYGENLSDRMRGNPTFGVDLLISLFESVSGISLPGWVKTALGQFGNNVDLAFIKLEFLYAPTIDIRYGMFYDIEEDSPAVATMDYVGQICAFKPADTFFGCRDTIDISTSFLVDPGSSIMRVTPGGLKQTLGIFMRDFTFSWRIGIKVSGCIGIPLCLPFLGCAGCLGYEDSFEYGVDVFDPINLLPDGGIRIPIITACDEAFMPGANIVTAIECSAGSSGGVSSFISGLVTELGANQVPGDPFFYDQVNDEFVFAPNRIPLLGNKIPEMDLRFGRLTQNEMNPSSVNGTALTVSGRNYNMFSATLDIFSLLFYALPQNIQQGFCAAGIDIGTRTINFGTPSIDEMGKCSVKFYNTYLSLDVLDLNAILRAEYNASYSFDPQITIDSMNLGFPTYWERPDAMVPTSGTSLKIENVGMDENIRFVVPDGLTEPFFIGNEFSGEGSFVGQDNKSQKLDFGIKMFDIVPALRFPVSLGPLVNLGPYNILTLSNTNIRNYNEPITIEGFSAIVSMQPDDIPPVIYCNDTTVFVNAEGLAFLDAETAFDRLASYDLPTGGSGSLNLIDVFPDTIYCSDYPSTTGYLVIEDDNCNFDTCAFTVTVMDTISPQIGCVDLVVALGANGMYVLNPDEIAVGATDNCSNLVVTATPNIFTCADVGIPRSVTITVTDIAGNSKSCVTTVTVVDTMQADIICPFLPAYPAVRNTLPNFCIYIPNATEFRPTVIANDCNTLVTYVLSGATTGSGSDNVEGVSFNLGTTLITYTATDESGNTRTCSFSVIVEDNEAPQIICPDNVTLSTNEDIADDYNCTTDHTWTHPTPGDNCTTIESYTVTYTSPTGVETTEDLTTRLGANDLEETRNFELGTTSIEYLATDTMDNEVICVYLVTVVDDEAPMIFCEEVIGCQNYTYSGDADIAPNDVTTFTLNVSNNINISDVNVILAGSADDIGLLSLDLVSPTGDTVNLFSNLCVGSTDFSLTLDDEAATAIGTAPCGTINAGNSYIPTSTLSDLDSTSSMGNWQLVVTSANLASCGFIGEFTLEICGNEETMDMATLVSILTDGDACEYAVDSTNFDPRFIDNCSNVRLSHNYAFSPTNTSLLGTVLPLGQTTITWTATDTAGNTSTCTMVYDVKDQVVPEFINCPEPDVIREAEPGTCGAFVNFALPIAFDNCDGQVAVVQTDGTGLGSGSLFPVGMTILVFQATDGSGNTSLCTVRVIVNDTQNGQFACPQDVIKSTDPGVFSAVVIGIAPTSIVDNCVNNNNISYKVEFPSGSGTIIGGGVQDASGDVFPKGISEVTYKLMSQPLLLITEVSQDIQAPVGGMDILPYTVSTNNDYVEITNFGPAAYNISGLDIERFGNGFLDVFTVPNMTILQSGETLVVHYGNGIDDVAAHFFNLPCAIDIATSEPAGYALSFKSRTLDVATTNGYNPVGQGTSAIIAGSDWTGSTGNSTGFGGIIRKYTFDNNLAGDFEISSNCYPLTIGALNPDLEAYAPNGFTTALQSIQPQVIECSFTVTVNDLEAPTCKEIVTDNIYNGGPIAGGFDSCNVSEITVPGAEDCILDSI
ncbi:MAG TPA: HYR domain-containing protein, partial [Saprospiraceae bacterium]|nr:HYR domain-containing protein [Saprospiraceae bacterium]